MAENNTNKETGKKLNPMIIIILLVVVVGLGTFGGVYLFMKNNNTEAKEIVETKVPILEEATVNLGDTAGKKYLKTSVYISYDASNDDLATEITDKTVEIKDKTIFYLKSKKSEDFNSGNETALKKELIAEINTLLTKGSIINVYFPADLLVQ